MGNMGRPKQREGRRNALVIDCDAPVDQFEKPVEIRIAVIDEVTPEHAEALSSAA